MSKEHVLELLSSLGIEPKKKLSQNFLLVDRVMEREAEYAQCEGEHVLEVGPGLGFLTEKLAEKALQVTAVEKDRRLIPYLLQKFSDNPKVSIVHADFLKREVDDGARIVVSNVPYSISSPLLFKLAEMRVERAVLCLQKEFADRLVALPGERNYSRLTVMAGLKFEPEFLEHVPNMAFYPAPKVHSSIVRLTTKESQPLDGFTREFITLVFQHKRKTLRSALLDSARNLKKPKSLMREAAASLSFSERRVYTLSKEELLQAAEETRLVLEG